jgi:hypothetical protein
VISLLALGRDGRWEGEGYCIDEMMFILTILNVTILLLRLNCTPRLDELMCSHDYDGGVFGLAN